MRGARAAVAFTFFAHGALFGTWVGRIPAVADELGLGEGELGGVLFAATLGAVVSLPLAGWVVSKRGSRTTVARALPVYALLLPALALAPNALLLALALFGFGLGAGALDVAMNAHGLAVERRYERPILSSFHAAWSAGGLAGAGGGSLVAAAAIDPGPHFGGAALLLGVVGLAMSRLLLPPAADKPPEGSRLRWPSRGLAALGVLAFCGLFAEGAASDWSAVYIAGPLDGGAAVAALGFAFFSVAMALFRLVGDRLTVAWGPVALIRRGGLLAGGGLALALVLDHPMAALVGFFCMGAGLAAVVPIVFRAAGSVPGFPAGAGIAALTTVGYSAFLVGPPVIGLAAELVGLRTALGLVVVLLALLAALAPRANVGT